MKKTFIAVLAVMVVLALTLGVTVACKDKTVTVTFKNGETTVSTVEVTEGAALTQEQIPAAPTAPQGKVFSGWYVGETKVEAGYKPTADVTAEAKYTDALTPNDITGMGTQASPYVIYTAKGLATFADNVNHPEVEETANWYKAYVRLGADIDMTGVKYNPAGSRAAKIGDAEQAEVVGFQGQFDGNGHTISNLTIEQNVRSTGYFGLFGFTTSGVYIHDVNIENMTVTAISGANTSDIRAYIGAVAGYLQLSQVDSVHASLTVNMQWLPSNVAVIGGIAGECKCRSQCKNK